MKRNHKHEEDSAQPQPEPDIAFLLIKIQQKLDALEQKMDSLAVSRPPRNFDNFRRRDNRDQGNSFREVRLTKAVCAECNQECEVPFKPTGDRPVYCKDCFSRRKQQDSFRGDFRKGPPREEGFNPRNFSDRKQGRKGPGGRGGRKPVSRRRKERA